MTSKKLLFVEPVERLVLKLQHLSVSQRRPLWQTYLYLRRSLRQTPLPVERTTQHLHDLITRGCSYAVVSLALKLAHVYTWQYLGARGAPCRAEKAVKDEYFHLVRRQLRHRLGLASFAPEPCWRRGVPLPDLAWRAVCDGSQKRQRSAAAVLVFDPQEVQVAQVCVAVHAPTAVNAELDACLHALRTLQALNARHAVVEVDALSVISAFEEKLPLRYCIEEAELSLLAEWFESLEIRLVPRVRTHQADRLAATLSAH